MKTPLTMICATRVHCAACREPGPKGDHFRAGLERFYALPPGWPACPFGVAGDPATRPHPESVPLTVGRTRHGVTIEQQPAATLEQAAGWALAAITGSYVTDDVRAERAATCAGCAEARYCPSGRTVWCAVCGCGTGGLATRKITDLTAYAENLPKWGCKHPRRAEGEGWRR